MRRSAFFVCFLLLAACSSNPNGQEDETILDTDLGGTEDFTLSDADTSPLPETPSSSEGEEENFDEDTGVPDDNQEASDDAGSDTENPLPDEIGETGDDEPPLVDEEVIVPEEDDLLLEDEELLPDEDTATCEVPEEWVAPVEDLLNPQEGKVQVALNGDFTDHYLFSPSNYLKVGIRENWGASIVFFGIAADAGSNVIDANDTGREVQVAFYDPPRSMQACAYDSSCLTHPELICANSIRYLGWDPVQGGNRCNIGSPVESIEESVYEIKAAVRPLFWNPDWDKPTCDGDGCTDSVLKNRVSDVRYRQRLRFVHSHIVEMMMEVENLSDTSVQPTMQEFPTLYAAYGAHGLANYKHILDSNGTEIAVDIPANDGFFYKNFDTPGSWAALQKDGLDYGVGIYYENRLTAYQAWQKDGVFNNIRAQFVFGIPAHGTVRARAYLILGSFATIAEYATWLDTHLPPFGYLDAPAPDSVHSGSVTLAGWVLDNKGVTSLRADLADWEGQPVRSVALSLDTDRPDVCAVYPGYAMCAGNEGFSGTLSLEGLAGGCSYLLQIVATDSDGNERYIARRRVRVE